MRNNSIRTIIVLFTIVLMSSCSAQNTVTTTKVVSNWEVLGERTVNMGADHDEITVTARKGTFRKLKFKVTQAPIYVKNVRIVYGNGSSENHKVNETFRKGHFTRVLDLNGKSRVIRKILFNYTTINVGKGRAKIIAFGKR